MKIAPSYTMDFTLEHKKDWSWQKAYWSMPRRPWLSIFICFGFPTKHGV